MVIQHRFVLFCFVSFLSAAEITIARVGSMGQGRALSWQDYATA
jgi:hypothetical protein